LQHAIVFAAEYIARTVAVTVEFGGSWGCVLADSDELRMFTGEQWKGGVLSDLKKCPLDKDDGSH
jgi:hypothetical protein